MNDHPNRIRFRQMNKQTTGLRTGSMRRQVVVLGALVLAGSAAILAVPGSRATSARAARCKASRLAP